MPILNVRNIGSVGVNSDIEPWDLPPDALTDGVNYRLSSNKVQSVGGTKPVAAASGDQLGHINQSTDFSGNSTWVVAGENSVMLYDGQSYTDIGSSVRRDVRFADLDPVKWSSCRIGQVMFLNHPDLYPIYWVDGQGTGGAAEALPWHIDSDPAKSETWDGKSNSCRIIRAHKNFLFALGMREVGDDFRDKVWWSHPAEPNGIPFSWRPTSEQPDSIAGWVNLGRGGSIVGGESLRDSFIIYSEEAINAMDFTGDALGWRRRSVSSEAGLASKEALVEVQGRHFFISPGDVQMFDGNSVTSIMHNRLRKRLASRLNVEALGNSWAAHNPTFNEIWFAVPENNDEHPRIAYAYNYRDNNWGIRDLEKPFRHAHFGVSPTSTPEKTWNNIDSVRGKVWDTMAEAWDDSLVKWKGEEWAVTWDQYRESWAMSSDAPFESSLLGVTGDEIHDIDVLNETFDDDFTSLDGKVWETMPGEWDTADVAWDDVDPRLNYQRTPTIIRRTDLPIAGHEANTTITRIYPLVEGTAPIQVRVGSQQHAGGPIAWAGDYRTFIPGKDRKIDVRTTGEVHCYEIKSEGGSFFNMTGMDIEFVPAGKR
jgi:hypothetical protein